MQSKFDKKPSWTELPIEMQLECIKRMDFRTRMRLRATSTQDKLLVESAPKFHFDKIEVKLDSPWGPTVFGHKDYSSKMIAWRNNSDNLLDLVTQILKFSTADTIHFQSKFKTDAAVSKFLAGILSSAPFPFKNIYLRCHKFEMVKFFVENCVSADIINVSKPSDAVYGPEFIEILYLPAMINAKNVAFTGLNVPTSDAAQKLTKDWIHKVTVAKWFSICYIGDNKTIDFFAENYKNHPSTDSAQPLRIYHTDGSSRELYVFSFLLVHFYFNFIVIPSDPRESE